MVFISLALSLPPFTLILLTLSATIYVYSMVFFNVMFGSTLVEPYIGELWIAHTADTMMKDATTEMGGYSLEEYEKLDQEKKDEIMEEKLKTLAKQSEFKKSKRVVNCAKNLRKRIADYMAIDKTTQEPALVQQLINAYVTSCHEEAVKIVAGAQGDLYCRTIGFTLETSAEEYLGFETSFLGMGGHLARSKQNASGFAGNMKLIGAGIKAAAAGGRAMNSVEKLQKDLEEQKAAAAAAGEEIDESTFEKLNEEIAAQQLSGAMDDSLPVFLEFAWAINKRDIQSTLQDVCKKLFDDASAGSKQQRLQRAEAVRLLGKEFRTVGEMAYKKNKQERYERAAAAGIKGKVSKFNADDIKAQMSVAAMTTMAKAQGQELTKEDQDEMLKQAKAQMAAGGGMDIFGGPGSASGSGDEGEKTDKR